MADAFYVRDGERFVPSELTRGPWDAGSQHAGPPAALLGRALENIPPPSDRIMRLGRVTYEILRPVPISPLTIETSVERDGKRVQMLSASLLADGQEVVRARAWRLVESSVTIPDGLAAKPPTHGPHDGESGEFFATGSDVGYHTAVEYRFVKGSWLEPGPATVWMRTRTDLVSGEELTPLQRVLIVADSGNGVSATLDSRKFLFINVDLTVHLHRFPVGEWICLVAETFPQPDGVGLADTALWDQQGPIGRAAQTLLVAAR